MLQPELVEIRREKILIPAGMTPKQIRAKFGLKHSASYRAKKQGFFVKNYMKKQIVIDRENFNPAAAYNLAGRVYWKNFAYKYPKVAPYIKEELIQEAVTRLFELSGKKSTTPEKYNDNYAKFWIAHNAQLAFLKTWMRQIRYKDLWQEALELLHYNPDLAKRLGYGFD